MSEPRPHACQMCPEGRRKLGRVRGLCQGHYRKCHLRVRAGETTWPALAALGLVHLTPEERGQKRNRLFGPPRQGSTLSRVGRVKTKSEV